MKQGLTLSAVDVEALPGLSDLFGGEMHLALESCVRRVLADILDPATPAGAERQVTIGLQYVPEADLGSAVVQLKKLSVSLAAPHQPASSRLVFDSGGGHLAAAERPGIREGLPSGENASMVAAAPLPTLAEVFDGRLDDAYRRVLVAILLNIHDPRAQRKPRGMTIVLKFKGDEDRAAVKCEVAKVEARLAPLEPPAPALLYLEGQPDGTVTVELEPGRYLPSGDGDVRVGRQSSIAAEGASSGSDVGTQTH